MKSGRCRPRPQLILATPLGDVLRDAERRLPFGGEGSIRGFIIIQFIIIPTEHTLRFDETLHSLACLHQTLLARVFERLEDTMGAC